jgi:hypothetical protein
MRLIYFTVFGFFIIMKALYNKLNVYDYEKSGGS